MDTPRPDHLIEEYKACEDEATHTANWLWNSTSLFLAAWIAGLGVAIANHEKFRSTWSIWLIAGAAVAAQLTWLPFLRRSFQIRQRCFARQKQIERRLDLLKSTAIEAADDREKARGCEKSRWLEKYKEKKKLTAYQADALKEYFELFLGDERPLGRADWIAWSIQQPFQWALGHAGRASLYVLSLMVALAWLTFAALLHKGV